MREPIEVFAEYSAWSDSVDFYFVRAIDGLRHVLTVKPELLVENVRAAPTLSLSQTACQTLMDRLWSCGFRATESKGSAGALAATEKHLDDMRRLAFNKSNVAHPDFK